MEGIYIQKENFVIRQITGTPEEMAQVLDVYRQCEDFLSLGPVPQASPAMVKADLVHSVKEGGIFCGIFDSPGVQMFGIVDFVPYGYEGDPELAFLSLLMIAASFRGQGMGEAVVHAVEEWIIQNNRIRAIRSGVQVNNPSAIRFWQRMGYKIASRAQAMEDGTVTYQLFKPITISSQT